MLEKYHEQFQKVSCQPHGRPSKNSEGVGSLKSQMSTLGLIFPDGWEVKNQTPSVGGVWFFLWNNTLNSAKFSMPFSVPFNNMQTLKLKAQPTNAFFASVNQTFGSSSQLPTTAKHVVIK